MFCRKGKRTVQRGLHILRQRGADTGGIGIAAECQIHARAFVFDAVLQA